MKHVLILTMAAALLLSSCRKEAGPVITEDRSVGPFTGIRIESNADVHFVQSNAFELRIEAGQNLMRYITTEVNSNGILVISERRNQIWDTRGPQIFVVVDSLNSLEITGSGDLDGSDFRSGPLALFISGSGDIDIITDATHVEAAISGSGDMLLEGTAQTLDLTISGSGDCKGQFFPVQTASVVISGSGDAYVNVSQSLEGRLSGSGDLFYWGNPASVNVTTSGSGSAIKR